MARSQSLHGANIQPICKILVFLALLQPTYSNEGHTSKLTTMAHTGLLALPVELRLQIFKDVLDIAGRRQHVQVCATTLKYCKNQRASSDALRLTCREVYRDVVHLTSRVSRTLVFCSSLCADRVLKAIDESDEIEQLEIHVTGLWSMQTEMLSGVSRLTSMRQGRLWKYVGSSYVGDRYVLSFEKNGDEKSEDGTNRGACQVQ